MNRTRWLLFSIAVFVVSTIALGISLWLYIYWYIKVRAGLKALMVRYDIIQTDVVAVHTWVVITVLSILVGLILVGIVLIFYYNLKSFQLFRLQRNFIDNFTHELKTPVTSLRLFLETFLRHDLEREEQVKYLHSMIEDVNRLSATINSILNLAEIQGKTYAGEFIEDDIAAVTESFIEKNQHMFKNAVISVENRTGAPCWSLISPTLFEMVLMNLLTNAVKYNISEQPRIDIVFEKHKKKISVRFIDNGIGIPISERKQIFRKFYQAGSARDRVDARKDEQGTIFTLRLPACKNTATTGKKTSIQ